MCCESILSGFSARPIAGQLLTGQVLAAFLPRLSINIFNRHELTRTDSRPSIKAMNDTVSKISRLEDQVSQLLELCKRLGDENQDLRAQLHQLSSERSSLIEHKEQARSHVEAMITRLRSMETA